jgi:hypothetical protein
LKLDWRSDHGLGYGWDWVDDSGFSSGCAKAICVSNTTYQTADAHDHVHVLHGGTAAFP